MSLSLTKCNECDQKMSEKKEVCSECNDLLQKKNRGLIIISVVCFVFYLVTDTLAYLFPVLKITMGSTTIDIGYILARVFLSIGLISLAITIYIVMNNKK